MTVAGPVIDLDSVSLCYRLAQHRVTSMKEFAIHWITGSLRYDQLWALSNVSLRVERGESVGIIGRNGAGKSTLLKVISRVLSPTRGNAHVAGMVAPVLALGTGFDFELTGRENITLNGLLLGHRRRNIDEHADAIIEFSGIRKFIDSPVRNYSSGMMARLAFSIATAWTPDLLILDEVLSVGDAEFRKISSRRIEEFVQAGTTVVMVSHGPSDILRNCTRCVWLDQGRVSADGPPKEVLAEYSAWVSAPHPAGPKPE